MRNRLALLTSIAVLAGSGFHAAGAGALTFGADLNAAVDGTATCQASLGALGSQTASSRVKLKRRAGKK